ncbi:MAG TPA: tetratricopeptide repeat protein [Longimicrobium sp.]|nr:tetratricopeptide repeat protein [Longimicrobium sp.]
MGAERGAVTVLLTGPAFSRVLRNGRAGPRTSRIAVPSVVFGPGRYPRRRGWATRGSGAAAAGCGAARAAGPASAYIARGPHASGEREMADESRIEALKKLVQSTPDDPRPRFGLALEYEKAGRWEDVVETLRDYLSRAEDEGNAYGRLGAALRRLGRDEEAKAAYRKGAEVAYRHAHPTMAVEFEEILENW